MTLSAGCVKSLQFFLMDAARRYAGPNAGGLSGIEELLSSAAALDYVLLLASEHPADIADSNGPAARGVRETLTRAAELALRVTRDMLAAPPAEFEDFRARHIEAGGFFDTLRRLIVTGSLEADDFRFALLTTASDVVERAGRR